MKSVKEKIAGAKLPETTVSICLRADLVAQFEQIDRQYAAAKAAGQDMLNVGAAERRALAAQLEALATQMREDTIEFRLRGMGRHAWDRLIAAHPKRPGVDADEQLGLNAATFWPALLRASVVDPDLDEQDWADLIEGDKLTDHQWSELCDAAWGLNRRDVSVPFSRAASAILALSESESKPPNDSGLASNASTGGNPPS